MFLHDLFWGLRKFAGRFLGNHLHRYRVKRLCMGRTKTGQAGPAARRLFADVSVTSKHDAGTGIQRVVRETVDHLLAEPGQWTIVPISGTRKAYVPARWPAFAGTEDGPLQPQPGDAFIGLDLSLDRVPQLAKSLRQWKSSGVRLWFVIYDLLPWHHPDWFSAKLVVRYRRWLSTILGLADGLLCISEPVADQVREELRLVRDDFDQVAVEILPLGWHFSRPFGEESLAGKEELDALGHDPFLLTVGTIEPRKGYADILDAMEILWAEGSALRLLVVGRAGWKTGALIQRFLRHPEMGRRLHWISDMSDSTLDLAYRRAVGLAMPSIDEGFGLPLLEARGRGIPVLARDISVFRWQAQDKISYFPKHASPKQIAGAITHWLSRDSAPLEASVPEWASWSNAARSIISAIEGAEIRAGTQICKMVIAESGDAI